MSDLLAIYLNDHLLGSTLGRDLARRAASSQANTDLGGVLERIAGEIDEDRSALLSLMRELGVGVDRAKVAAGWVGEKLGRLKPNGHLLSRSPLSTLIELEGLMLGVRGKLGLWEALAQVPRAAAAGAVDLPQLIRRAEAQHEELARQRLRIAAQALDQR